MSHWVIVLEVVGNSLTCAAAIVTLAGAVIKVRTGKPQREARRNRPGNRS